MVAIYHAPWFVWLVVALGVVTRLRDYVHNRSLWLDETKIATNLLTRSFAGLLQPLDFEQGGPVGWLFAVKAATLAFGGSEWGLRLVSVLSGSAAVILFPFVARKFVPRAAVPLAVMFLSFGILQLYFSVEAKQYITDVFFAVALLAVFPEPAGVAWRRYVPVALVGVVAIPCSHPAVFTLAGISLVWGLLDLKHRRMQALALHGGISVLWGLVILLNYVLFLRELGRSEHLKEFWAEDFMPTAWRLGESVPWLVVRIYETFESKPLNFEIMAIPALLVWGLGAVATYRRRRMHLLLLTAPLGFGLLAAALHQYPFDSRMILFLVPSLVLVVSAGVTELWRILPGRTKGLAVVLAIGMLAPHLREGWETLYKGSSKEELSSVLRRVKREIQPGEGVFLGPSAAITWRYYTQLHPRELDFTGHRVMEYMGDDKDISNSVVREHGEAPVPARVWFVFTHYEKDDRDKMLKRLERVGDLVPDSEYTMRGSSAYLFEMHPERIKDDED